LDFDTLNPSTVGLSTTSSKRLDSSSCNIHVWLSSGSCYIDVGLSSGTHGVDGHTSGSSSSIIRILSSTSPSIKGSSTEVSSCTSYVCIRVSCGSSSVGTEVGDEGGVTGSGVCSVPSGTSSTVYVDTDIVCPVHYRASLVEELLFDMQLCA